MHRWATLLLISLLLVVQNRPAAATLLAGVVQPPPLPFQQPMPMRKDNCVPANHAVIDLHSDRQRCLALYAASLLTELTQAADLIVRGRVIAVHSFWHADHSLIASDATIAISYKLLGSVARTVTIRTPGGYLAAEGLGMSSLHAATFSVGEEVLLFAHQHGTVWQVVNGATGKFLIQGDQVANPDLGLAQPLNGLLPTVVALLQQRGATAQLPIVWRNLQPPHQPAPVQLLTAQSNVRTWATPHATATFYINLNTPQVNGANGDRAAFRRAILAAAASWSGVTSADFTLAYAGETDATQTSYNGVNEVLFIPKGKKERAAAAQVWYTAEAKIVEADIWINDDYGWDATGAPLSTEVDLQSALLHEFGHWLILGHFTDATTVMFPRLTAGTVKRNLQQPDILGISAIYPH